jgi:RES domain-containing protein
MILWRVSNYATLDGAGGLHVSGRWHTRGRPVLYCTWNPSTALLETLVHIEIDADDRPERVQVVKIEGPDSLPIERINTGELLQGWIENWSITRQIGDEWLASCRTLLLEVPCVLSPETWNVLVNPQHSQADGLKIVDVIDHSLDERFFR